MMRSLLLVLGICVLASCGDDGEDAPQNNFIVTTLGEPFNGSGGVAVDNSGNIYVGDFGDQLGVADGTTVTRLTPQGGSSLFAEGFSGASGNTFDAEGNFYQANIAGNRISKVNTDGTIETYAEDNISGPVGIKFDSQGNLYVCNCNSRSIARVSPDGQSELFSTSGLLNCPNGIALDDQDNVYVVNFNNTFVVKITQDGTAETLAEVESGGGHITFANGRLYSVARGAAKVFEIALDGTVTVIAGTGEPGNDDGPALESTFWIPNGIDASPDGSKLYVTSRLIGVGSALNPVVVRVVNLTP